MTNESKIDSHLKDISEIRNLMERSSKVLSLSGLSGISAGLIALVGAIIAHNHIRSHISNPFLPFFTFDENKEIIFYLVCDAAIILLLSLGTAAFFSIRMAKRKNYPVWNNTSKWMLASLFVPLSAGGIFCLVMIYHGTLYLVAPATLMFYGMSLLNASKYTVPEIRYLALSEMGLGILAAMFAPHGLLFWAIGFGLLHIVYGTLMYYKYEK